MKHHYSLVDDTDKRTINAIPSTWNKTGVFVLNKDTSQKDLRYLRDVIGIKGIQKTEQQITTRDVKKEIDKDV